MKTVRTIAILVAVLGILVLDRPVVATEGMISYWRFDEGDGTTVDDCWGGNHGTIYGAQWTTGIVNSALSFDGVDDYVYVYNDASLSTPASTQELTMEAWIHIEVLTNEPGILSKRTGTNFDHEYQFCIRNGYLDFTFCRWIGDWQNPIYTSDGTDLNGHKNEWLHAVVTIDGTEDTVKFYLNGVQDGSTFTFTDSLVPTSGYLRIGVHPWGAKYFGGLIDEVAIYNRALTSEEIAQHYENGLRSQGYLTIPVAIDIKPGSYPNSLNMDGRGVIPVAILGSAEFDVTEIDVSSLSFAGLAVRVKGQGQPQCSVEDVSGDFSGGPEGAPDGHPDLVCHFVDDPDNWSPGDGEATITGTLTDGTPFAGSDEITVVPPQ